MVETRKIRGRLHRDYHDLLIHLVILFSHLHNYRMRAAIQNIHSWSMSTSSRSTPLCSTTQFYSHPCFPGAGWPRQARRNPRGPSSTFPAKSSNCPDSRSGGRSTTTATAMSSWITTHSTAHATHAHF